MKILGRVDSRLLVNSYLESVPTSHYEGKAVVQQMGIFTPVIITVIPESANNRSLITNKNGDPKAAVKDTAKTVSAVYRLTLFMNQVQINQCTIAAHRYVGIVFYQAAKHATFTRFDVGTQQLDIRATFCPKEVGVAKRFTDGCLALGNRRITTV